MDTTWEEDYSKEHTACKGDLDRRRGQRDTSRKLEDDGGGSSKEQSSRWRRAVVYFPPTGGDKAQVKYPGLLQRHCSKKGRLSEGANRTGVHWMGQRGTTTFANPLTPKNRQARYDCDWWSMVAGQWFTIVCVNTSMVGVSCCVANVFLRVVSWHFPVFNCTVCARMKLFFLGESRKAKYIRWNMYHFLFKWQKPTNCRILWSSDFKKLIRVYFAVNSSSEHYSIRRPSFFMLARAFFRFLISFRIFKTIRFRSLSSPFSAFATPALNISLYSPTHW